MEKKESKKRGRKPKDNMQKVIPVLIYMRRLEAMIWTRDKIEKAIRDGFSSAPEQVVQQTKPVADPNRLAQARAALSGTAAAAQQVPVVAGYDPSI